MPVWELSEAEMFDVTASISLTIGSESDIPYFVPRWCADGLGYPVYDITLAFCRMSSGDFPSWPSEQRTAVRNFLAAQLRYVLMAPPAKAVGESLNSIRVLYECLTAISEEETFFAAWTPDVPSCADQHLAELLHNWSFQDGRVIATLSYATQPADRLICWLRSPEMYARLQRGVNLYPYRAAIESALSAVDDAQVSCE